MPQNPARPHARKRPDHSTHRPTPPHPSAHRFTPHRFTSHLPDLSRFTAGLRRPHLVLGAAAAVVTAVVVLTAAVVLLPASDSSAATVVRPATVGEPVAFATGQGLDAPTLLANPAVARQVASSIDQADTARRVAAYLQAVARQQAAEVQAAEQRAAQERAAAARQAAQRQATSRPAAPRSSAGTGACGGDLPPCCVMMRESHGNPNVVNRSSGAAGKWQFMPGTWNHYMGYASAADAPAWVQDQKARQVYAGGAGAGHWAGPGC